MSSILPPARSFWLTRNDPRSIWFPKGPGAYRRGLFSWIIPITPQAENGVSNRFAAKSGDSVLPPSRYRPLGRRAIRRSNPQLCGLVQDLVRGFASRVCAFGATSFQVMMSKRERGTEHCTIGAGLLSAARGGYVPEASRVLDRLLPKEQPLPAYLPFPRQNAAELKGPRRRRMYGMQGCEPLPAGGEITRQLPRSGFQHLISPFREQRIISNKKGRSQYGCAPCRLFSRLIAD